MSLHFYMSLFTANMVTLGRSAGCARERACGEPKGRAAVPGWGKAGAHGFGELGAALQCMGPAAALVAAVEQCRLPRRALKGECFLTKVWLGSPGLFGVFFSFLQICGKMFCHWLDWPRAHKWKTQLNLLDNHWHGHTHLSHYFDKVIGVSIDFGRCRPSWL